MLDDTDIHRLYQRLQADDHSAILRLGKELTDKVLTGRAYSKLELETFYFAIEQMCGELGIEFEDTDVTNLMGMIHYRLAQFWRSENLNANE
jgi:hypothetical protein